MTVIACIISHCVVQKEASVIHIVSQKKPCRKILFLNFTSYHLYVVTTGPQPYSRSLLLLHGQTIFTWAYINSPVKGIA